MNSITALSFALVSLLACDKAPDVSPPAGPSAVVAPAAPSATPATPAPAASAASLVGDMLTTSAGPVTITPIHHGSILFSFAGKSIFVDPWHEGASYSGMPKADYVFISDIHPDHLDDAAIDLIAKPGTVLVGPKAVDDKRKLGVVMANGESHDFGAFKVEAIPMYNVKRGPEAGKFFHDKGRGDGFVFTFGDKRVYVSGDTECTPEMKALRNIDVAFVCMNLPYTMPPEEAAECVKAFKPKVVYPYHFKGSDPAAFASQVASEKSVEVRVRKWY